MGRNCGTNSLVFCAEGIDPKEDSSRGGLPVDRVRREDGSVAVIAANLIVGAAALLTALRSRTANANSARLVPGLAATETEPPLHCD